MAEEAVQLDTLLAGVAGTLIADGWRLAGALGQPGEDADRMTLRLLPEMRVLCISQKLGRLADGCRLDTAALAEAVGLSGAALDAARAAGKGAPGPLLIVNRFGKTEAEGRGFRPLIGHALSEGVPVLIAVKPAQMAAFAAFTEGMSQALPADIAPVLVWCRAQAATGQG